MHTLPQQPNPYLSSPSNLIAKLTPMMDALSGTTDQEQVFLVFRKLLPEIGLRGGISLLDESSENLIFHAVATTGLMNTLVPRLEKVLGFHAEGYAVQIQRVDVYTRVIKHCSPVYISDSSYVSSQAIPGNARPLMGTILRMLGGPPAIYVPLLKNDIPAGMLNLVGRGLGENEVPAVQHLAGLIAGRLFA